MDGVYKGQNLDYVIFEWSLICNVTPLGGKDYNWTISNVCDLMGFKEDRRSNVFIGDFPAELPIFDAYRKSLSLEFKMDLGLEMAAKMFLRTVSKFNLYTNHNFLKMWCIGCKCTINFW